MDRSKSRQEVLIPAELQADHKWVVWRLERVGETGRVTKVPYSPRTHCRASATNPRGWTDFDTANRARLRMRVNGVAFVITKDSGFVGIDIDGCRNKEDGTLTPWAQEVVGRLNTYTEASQSGTGIHLLVKAKIPDFGRKRPELELYDGPRCWIVTGRHIEGTPELIEQRQTEVSALHRQLFPRGYQPTVPTTERYRRTDLPDQEVIRRCMTMPKFQQLFRGDLAGYTNGRGEPDQSAAELAFANLVKIMTSDHAQIDRIYRQSGLKREKWDQRRGPETYGARTIDLALGVGRSACRGR